MQRYPRNIHKNIKSFKAEELGSFLTRWLLPLVHGRVSEQTFRALQRLVFVISKAVGIEVDDEEIDEMEYQMNQFLRWFYSTFYAKKNQYLSACKYTLHALTHLTQNLRDWGPASYYWQFTEVYHYVNFEANLRSAFVGSWLEALKVVSVEVQTCRFSCISINLSLSPRNTDCSQSGCERPPLAP